MGFYRCWPRAWIGSFRLGWLAETRRRKGRWRHPYLKDLAVGVIAGATGYVLAGLPGLLLWIGLALHAQMQLLLTDYVQHYGLRRGIRADGRPEPVGPAHAWNAAPLFSGRMLLNAPRHSDHHLHPARRFPDLALAPQMPLLPRSLPVMAAVALCPSLWRRIMDPRVAARQAGAGAVDLQGSSHADALPDSRLSAGAAPAG
jgi:alkane 1-monooxygenase